MPPVPLAHPGHWLAELMYVLPVVVIVGWIAIQSLRDRREEARKAEQEGGGEGAAPKADPSAQP